MEPNPADPQHPPSPAEQPQASPAPAEPPRDCPLCPRLAEYRAANRVAHPDWFNAPVPGWGDPKAWLCVVGLAPGVTGANRTGRPFTGDHAGLLLYATLAKFGLSHGVFDARPDDGLVLDGVFISNAVRCVPPENKPVPAEIHTCRQFLTAQLAALPNLKVVLALGTIAHQSAVKALGGKLPKVPFAHAAVHRLHTGYTLVDSYHCSRYNTNTGRLTAPMFEEAFAAAIAAR
nr:uracil-DNA glycosylase [Polymorphobacter sp.]